LLAHPTDLQPEAAQDPAQAVLHVPQLLDEQLAGREQGPDLLCEQSLGVHGPEPAQAHQVRDPARVVPVRLVRHRRKGRPDVPGLDQHGRQARRAQPGVQPLRQRPGLEPDPLERQAGATQEGRERLRLAVRLALAHDLARPVDHAHAARLQRNVDPGEVPHGRPSAMPGADQLGPRPRHQRGRRRRPANRARVARRYRI
jgi:hypothetical protein